MWKLKRLDDAGSLLLIEMALLLDPTFFSNAFLTMLTLDGNEAQVWGTNLICLGLVPLKLLLLARLLKFKLHDRLLFGYVAAAAFVYIGAAKLNLPSAKGSETEIFYVMSWMPLALVLILPTLKSGLSFVAHADGFVRDGQGKWLPRLAQFMTIAIVFFHLIESAVLYQFPFYGACIAPFLLCIAMLMIRNLERESIEVRTLALDILGVIAFFLSLPTSLKLDPHRSAFVEGESPAICAAAVIALLYVYIAFAYKSRWAMLRVVVIAAAGLGFWIASRIDFPAVGRGVEGYAELAVGWVIAHAIWFGAMFEIVLIALAIRFRNAWTWRLAAWGAILGVLQVLPEMERAVWPEALQVALALEIFLCHWFGDEDRSRYTWAFALILVSSIRFYQVGDSGQIIFSVSEAVALAALGFLLAESIYLVFALGLVIVISAGPAWGVMRDVPVPIAVICSAVITFAIGVAVTFTKDRLLRLSFVSNGGALVPPPDWLKERLAESKPIIREATKEETEMKYELVIERPESESLEPELQIDYSPKATQTDPTGLVRELFPMDDPSRGIHRVPQEVEGILRRERMNLALRAGEKLLSEFFDTDSERSILFLTDSRVIVMASAEPGVSSESSMEYTEMIAVGRSMEAVYFTGRYGEQLGVYGLNVYQAAVLKKGLEAMIAQINAE